MRRILFACGGCCSNRSPGRLGSRQPAGGAAAECSERSAARESERGRERVQVRAQQEDRAPGDCGVQGEERRQDQPRLRDQGPEDEIAPTWTVGDAARHLPAQGFLPVQVHSPRARSSGDERRLQNHVARTRQVYTEPSGPVAQLVEQGTFNPKVAGSIPARPITKGLQGQGIRFLRRLLLVARVRVEYRGSDREGVLHFGCLKLSLGALPVSVDVGRHLQRRVAEVAREPGDPRTALERALRERVAKAMESSVLLRRPDAWNSLCEIRSLAAVAGSTVGLLSAAGLFFIGRGSYGCSGHDAPDTRAQYGYQPRPSSRPQVLGVHETMSAA